MEYTILKEATNQLSELEFGSDEWNDYKSIDAMVNQYISNGWEPIGGLSVIRVVDHDGEYFIYHQAMIRR